MTTEDLQRITNLPLPWEKLADKNILVLGATGLIGSAIVTTLQMNPAKSYNVYAAGRSISRLKKRFEEIHDSSLHYLEHDLAYPIKSDINFHYVVDCASDANPAAFNSHPVEIIHTNIIGVDNILNYGLNHGMERFLYISSGEIYGEGDGRKFDEEYSGYVNVLDPRACYPTSKRAAENLCVAYRKEYNLDIVIARPCHVFGPYFKESDDRAYAQFLRNALAGENIVLKSPGLIKRSWCYVADCTSAIFYILLKGENGQAYNIASKENEFTIRDFATAIANVIGTDVIYDIPSNAPKAIISQGILDSTKLTKLGWKPELEFSQQILSTIEELRK